MPRYVCTSTVAKTMSFIYLCNGLLDTATVNDKSIFLTEQLNLSTQLRFSQVQPSSQIWYSEIKKLFIILLTTNPSTRRRTAESIRVNLDLELEQRKWLSIALRTRKKAPTAKNSRGQIFSFFCAPFFALYILTQKTEYSIPVQEKRGKKK